ncbi:dephospho-CoA kinase [Thaumasiovibrio subtropicus]|uniref:dephospho-CoA kinase n=1 Tax=Thaumasiovibrio subtropicus TaxID=1891207 RepID=UPI000B35655A|nr:dephospho-CoA kinase [Thaumasiovibrio subtropicus]
MTLIIGLTGGIGSGKTTVANKFAEKGVPLVDADIVARQVVEPNSQGLTAIIKKFGSDLLLTDGSLNRGKLRELVFSNPDNKVWIDALLHPMIRKEMQRQLDAISSEYCLLVVPLLVENGLQSMTDRVLVVDVSAEQQQQRTRDRDGVSNDQVARIIALQASREERLSIADDVIDNSRNTADLDQQINTLHQKYLQLAAKHR